MDADFSKVRFWEACETAGVAWEESKDEEGNVVAGCHMEIRMTNPRRVTGSGQPGTDCRMARSGTQIARREWHDGFSYGCLKMANKPTTTGTNARPN